MSEQLPKLSNPRTEATIDDWPIGRQRCRARFEVESGKRGERVSRRTENKARTGWNAPKVTTYAMRARIADGDDGRTYIIRDVGNHIAVMRGDMKHSAGSLFPGDPGHADVLSLFDAEPALDGNSKLVLDSSLRDITARRGEWVLGTRLRRSVLSMADAIRGVDGAGTIKPEHVLEAIQYLTDSRTLHGFLREKTVGGQPASGPGSPIYGRLEAVFSAWGRAVPEPTNESLQELAESVGFRFDGPAAGPG